MKYCITFLLFSWIWQDNSAQSSGGFLTSSATVCAGNNSGILTVAGYSGTIVRWECSPNVNGPWLPIIFTSTSYNYINLIQSTYFRVVVQLFGYAEATSNSVLITCHELSVAGTITSNTLQCINTPVTFVLTGNTGSVIAWEYTTNAWITTNTITTTNTLSATLAPFSTTTTVRAKVRNGVCPILISNLLTVNPAVNSIGGNISGTSTVCAISNSSTLTLNNYTGTILQWESSISSGGPFNVISSTTNTISYTNLSQDTWYRALVKNSTCVGSNSSIFHVTVDAPSVGGSILGPQNICAFANSGTLQLISGTGQINQWDYSSNGGVSWNPISNTTSVQTFSNISITRIYRAHLQNGVCPPALSNQFVVNVNALPTPTFNLTNICSGSISNFTNTTSGINTFVWDFGDSSSSNIFNPNHLYTTAGTFSVKLTATSLQNCIDSIKKTIIIYPNPTASYSSLDTICFGNSILFTNSSSIISGSITNISFNFSDGSSSSTLSPVHHFFPGSGSYPVYITATSNFGCKDSSFNLVSVYPKPNTAFFAQNICKGDPCNFNNLSAISNGWLQSHWNFGNSILSTLQSPVYIYPTAGVFTVSLISKSDHNCKDTAFRVVTVNEKPEITFTATNVCLGTPVNFSATFHPFVPSITTTVNFGDGNSASSPNPFHNYFSSGTFLSGITAITDSGCVSSKGLNITVYPKPLANFNFKNGCNDDTVQFNNTSSIANGNLFYLWDFSGLATSTLNTPLFLFPQAGNFTISLTAISNFGCEETFVKPINIFDAPKADFMFSNSCDGSPVTFTNTSKVNSGSISKNDWDFGDNSTATVVNPSKEYLNNGTYFVTLISESSNGCRDSVKKLVRVYEGPVAKFSASNACLNTAIHFENLSLLASGTYSSTWRFGDSTITFEDTPSHLYKKSGSYVVWLKTVTNNLCVDSVSRFVEVFPLPKINAGFDTTINKGFGVRLNAKGGLTYSWYPTEGLNNPVIQNPFSNPQITTTYFVAGTDENKCKGFDTISVTVKNDFLVIPYNILTPDDLNGLNDHWVVKNIEAFKENHVVIFDQWNQKVFETESYPENVWDGKNLRGEILADGTYYYILTFKNSPVTYSGYITLIRNVK